MVAFVLRLGLRQLALGIAVEEQTHRDQQQQREATEAEPDERDHARAFGLNGDGVFEVPGGLQHRTTAGLDIGGRRIDLEHLGGGIQNAFHRLAKGDEQRGDLHQQGTRLRVIDRFDPQRGEPLDQAVQHAAVQRCITLEALDRGGRLGAPLEHATQAVGDTLNQHGLARRHIDLLRRLADPGHAPHHIVGQARELRRKRGHRIGKFRDQLDIRTPEDDGVDVVPVRRPFAIHRGDILLQGFRKWLQTVTPLADSVQAGLEVIAQGLQIAESLLGAGGRLQRAGGETLR